MEAETSRVADIVPFVCVRAVSYAVNFVCCIFYSVAYSADGAALALSGIKIVDDAVKTAYNITYAAVFILYQQ